jgi:hypothetical protein
VVLMIFSNFFFFHAISAGGAVPDAHVVDYVAREIYEVLGALWVQPASERTIILSLTSHEEPTLVRTLADTEDFIDHNWFRN